MVRRIRQACGASTAAKENNQHRHHGTSKDDQIGNLFTRGLNGPEISRLIGTDHSFVYRRLRALKLI
ncbi:MAG: hypothetical protein KF716_24110 [Anaerolineae bacterium]|nr:hypothetical protein [Anaerolineae bacterium]